MSRGCCFGCTERAVGCHGKREDGTWVCEKWGKVQDDRAADYETRKQEIKGYKDVTGVRWKFYHDCELRKRNHGY